MKNYIKPTIIIVAFLLLAAPFLLIAKDLLGGKPIPTAPLTYKRSASSHAASAAYAASASTQNPSVASTAASTDSASAANLTPSPEASPEPTLPSAEVPTPVPTPVGKHDPSQYLIAIDAGHGGNDIGTQTYVLGYLLYEKDLTLRYAKQLNNILTSAGYNVLMIRNGDESMDRRDRIRLANARDAALYVNIHFDWFADSSISGTATFYSLANKNSLGSLTHYSFAEIIHRNIMRNNALYDRGIRSMADFAVLRLAEMPSVLIELGFVSSYTDMVNLVDQNIIEKLCQGIFAGIKESLDKSTGK